MTVGFFQLLPGSRLAKESLRALVIEPLLETVSGIESWLCDVAELHGLSEPRVCHMESENERLAWRLWAVTHVPQST